MAARRGKSQAKRGGAQARRVPGWIWLLAGLLLGLALSVFVLMREGGGNRGVPRPNPEAQAPRETERAPAVAPPPAAEEKPRKPRYDFYTVLPGKEVLVPDSELAQKARDEAAAPSTAAPATERYVLQAGAFRDTRDAEALKARVALSGLVARVETAQIDNRPIYRVRLGPYASARELEAAKKQLADNGISQTIAVREPNS